MQLPVYIDGVYRPGVTVAGQLHARLSWSEDNRVRLVTSSGTPEAPVYTEIFSVPASEIVRVASFTNMVKFTLTDGSVHRFEIVPMGAYGMATVAGIISATHRYKQTGFDNWLEAFKAAGVQTSRVSFWKLLGIVAAVLVPAIVIMAFIVVQYE